MKRIIRSRAVEQVTNQLVPTEAALSETISSAAKLIEVSINSRNSALLSISCGHQALKGMSIVLNILVQAQEELIKVHKELAEISDSLGLPEQGYGAIGRCPLRPHGSKLSIIADAA